LRLLFKTSAGWAILLACVFLIGGSVAAQTDTYPTVTALEQTVIPPIDAVALAQSLRRVGEIPPPPTTPPVWTVGDQQTFWVTNNVENIDFQVTATLRVIGDHIYMWLENGAQVSDEGLQSLADAFDNSIYKSVRDLWGSEANPGVDGDPRLYGLFAHGMGTGIAAYFLSRHTYPVQVYPTSNHHEMFFFNLDTIDAANIASPYLESLVAHEFQHMIRANLQRNEALWLNEGFSTFTQLLLFNEPSAAAAFLSTPQTQLNTWTEEGAREPHYGASIMFVDYFYERYGLDAIHRLSTDPGTGLDAFDHVLKAMDEPGVNDLFADWVLANYFLNPDLSDEQYGYQNFPDTLTGVQPIGTAVVYPYITNSQANQYTADYYALTNQAGAESLKITLNAPDMVQLIPADAPSGEWMWYSNRGDMSDTTLTQTFDLSAVDQATLNYKAWYYIEDGWDYGYVMVSADDGATWDILSTPHSSDVNPHGNAYGSGYTGQSGAWIDESVSLDAYAGKIIQVRFEMMTDDGITQPGLAIDDVQIPEIGYSNDFEADAGGWETDGWIRIDNRLPQQIWVQAAQVVGDTVHQDRWLAAGDGEWSLKLIPGAEQIVLAVSPFAPVTTVPITYTLNIQEN
jgi:immune inhibitor A